MVNPRIFVVDDDLSFRDIVQSYLQKNGFDVICGSSCKEAEQLYTSARPDAAILDYSLPDGNILEILPRLHQVDATIPIIILTGHALIELAVQAIKLGAEQFVTKPVDLSALLVILQRSLENRRLVRHQAQETRRRSREGLCPFLGSSARIRELEDLAARVASSDSPVIIQGETGSGKGVLAKWVHEHSNRAKETFVDLNCGGLSREFLETELFGHEKGAFTGAVQSKAGLLEIAHKGTLFLDEIADIDVAVQPKVLKVLEEKHFHRLGDIRERHVDIRLIAATHRNLALCMKEGRFREDLFFRISTIPLIVPPLRDRVEDIPVLVARILERLSAELNVPKLEITIEALTRLQSYSWPGNIRQLKNVLERSVLFGGKRIIEPGVIHFDQADAAVQTGASPARTLEQVERDYIEQVMQFERGRVEAAARVLNISRSTLYAKLKQYKLTQCAQSAASGS
jgi:DNA-binding NtrC family response regulator